MKSVKLLLITSEISALLCLILLQFAPTTCDMTTKGLFTIMFGVVAVWLQSMQQDIKWNNK